MSAARGVRGRSLVANVLARAEAFLLEPVESAASPAAIRIRPVVAVVALGRGCGTTVVARALAVELAARDLGAAVVAGGSVRTGPLALATPASSRLARALGTGHGEPRPTGRLCLVEESSPASLAAAARHLAPLVFEVAHGQPAGAAASLADHCVLVAAVDTEPALAEVVASSLARVGPRPVVVVSRVAEGEPRAERWRGRAATMLGRSPLGARLALRGREPRGALGSGLDALADRCSAPGEPW